MPIREISFVCHLLNARSNDCKDQCRTFVRRYLCSDLVYVVLFPQLLAVIHWPTMVDTYGCLAGYFIAIVLRLGG